MSTSFPQRDLHELVQLAIPVHGEEARGIYYLFREGVVVYVGSSQNPARRVQQHQFAGEKAFDAYHIEIVHDDNADLATIEAQEILRLQPTLNRTLPTNTVLINSGALKRQYGVNKHDLNRLERSGQLQTMRFKDGCWYPRSDIARLFDLPGVVL